MKDWMNEKLQFGDVVLKSEYERSTEPFVTAVVIGFTSKMVKIHFVDKHTYKPKTNPRSRQTVTPYRLLKIDQVTKEYAEEICDGKKV